MYQIIKKIKNPSGSIYEIIPENAWWCVKRKVNVTSANSPISSRYEECVVLINFFNDTFMTCSTFHSVVNCLYHLLASAASVYHVTTINIYHVYCNILILWFNLSTIRVVTLKNIGMFLFSLLNLLKRSKSEWKTKT